MKFGILDTFSPYLIAGSMFFGFSSEVNCEDGVHVGISVAASEYKTNDNRFTNDTDKVLLARMIFGEGRECSEVEKMVIAYTVVNRAMDGKRWNGETVRSAILKPYQYSCFNRNDPNLRKLMNPENFEPGAWRKCLNFAGKVLDENYPKLYNIGATHFYAKGTKKPSWASSPGMIPLRAPEDFKHWYFRER